MAEKRGGAREGAGRKPKATELELVERLSPMDDIALKQLEQGVKSGDYNFLKLFMEYRYGKPKQQTEITGKDGKDLIPQVDYSKLTKEELKAMAAIEKKLNGTK